MKTICQVCIHHCALEPGQTGLCGARKNVGGEIVCENYGMVTAMALDPIEKKPLYDFHPGSRILSVGSYGCNLRCPFCRDYYSISWQPVAKPFTEASYRCRHGMSYTVYECRYRGLGVSQPLFINDFPNTLWQEEAYPTGKYAAFSSERPMHRRFGTVPGQMGIPMRSSCCWGRCFMRSPVS